MSESEGRIRLGREPIPGDSPAGQPVADEPEFEALKAEATKDPIHGPVDWAKVVKLGSEVLGSKGKDFVAASYLAVGLAREHGFAGLADGLGLLEALVAAFWEQGFPPVPRRMRARSAALAWMAEQAAKVVESTEGKPEDRDALERANQHLADLAKLLDERMEDAPPLGDLIRGLRTALERLPEAPPPAAASPAAAAPAQGAPAAGGAAARPAAPAPRPAAAPAAAPTDLVSRSDALQALFKVAGFFREKEPTNALSYRLLRAGRWAEIAGPPPAQDGQTQLLPPPPERVSGLRSLADRGDWPALLQAAEDAFRERPLWLDAQHYADRALEGLGGPYAAAREGVALELRALLSRVPELPGLAFKDGSPLAASETREWIQSAVVAGGDGAAGGATAAATTAVAAGVDEAAVEEARGKARELLRKKRVGEALRVLDEALGGDRSPRQHFLARLEIATLCADAGLDRLAQPMLEELDEAVAAHGLERWEPDLALAVLRTLYRCRRRLAEQRGALPEAAARAEEVFARLCRIDPVAAASLESL